MKFLLLVRKSTCLFSGIRASALPLHRPNEFQQEWKNLSSNATATFIENRPYEGVYYYVLVVSNGRVGFDINLKINHCGDSGIYGPSQKDWYLVSNKLRIWFSRHCCTSTHLHFRMKEA